MGLRFQTYLFLTKAIFPASLSSYMEHEVSQPSQLHTPLVLFFQFLTKMERAVPSMAIPMMISMIYLLSQQGSDIVDDEDNHPRDREVVQSGKECEFHAEFLLHGRKGCDAWGVEKDEDKESEGSQ